MILLAWTRRHDRRFFNDSIVIITAIDIGHISIKTIEKNVERVKSIDDDDDVPHHNCW
jgi:hypothetical protein